MTRLSAQDSDVDEKWQETAWQGWQLQNSRSRDKALVVPNVIVSEIAQSAFTWYVPVNGVFKICPPGFLLHLQ
jgi:hypothetical protein